MAFQHDDISIKTVIGAGSSISGDLKVEGFTRFDGDINGNLETKGQLIIGDQARIRGNVTALSAIINGIVEGDIIAPEGVRLFTTASVRGDIITQKLFVEENVFLQGQCIVLDDTEAYLRAKAEWQDKKAIREKSLLQNRSIH